MKSFLRDNFSSVLLIGKSLPSLSHFKRPCFGTAKVLTFFAYAIFILNLFINLKQTPRYLFLRAAKVNTFSTNSNTIVFILQQHS